MNGPLEAAQGLAQCIDLAFVGRLLAFGFLDQLEQFVECFDGVAQGTENQFGFLDGLSDGRGRRGPPGRGQWFKSPGLLMLPMGLERLGSRGRAGGVVVKRFRRRFISSGFLGSGGEERLMGFFGAFDRFVFLVRGLWHPWIGFCGGQKGAGRHRVRRGFGQGVGGGGRFGGTSGGGRWWQTAG